MPPSGPPGKEYETRVTTRPKALVSSACALFGALVCIAAYLYDYLEAMLVAALAAEAIVVAASVLLWRFERPRELRFKGRTPEPPVIHGV